MSLPQSLSRSLILLMLLGNLVLIPPVSVLTATPILPTPTAFSVSLLVYLFGFFFLLEQRMSRRRGLRHPVCLIWRTEISVDSASSGERTLAMPGRKLWGCWGGKGGGGAGNGDGEEG